MARSGAALKLADSNDRKEERPGDSTLTREAMAAWNDGQRRCRARGRHNWGPHTVYEHRTYYEVVERCSHCKNRRHANFIKTTHGLRQEDRWQPVYNDGYLLPKGALSLRYDDDLKDELTAADILSRRIVEVLDDE